MQIKIFTEHVKKEGITIIPRKSSKFNPNALSQFRKLKEFFNYIDFGCSIKRKGDGVGCKEMDYSRMCCCGSCRSSSGHFRSMIDEDLKYYARRFSVETGFWRQDKGCNLIHGMRSTLCLTHHCNHDSKSNFDFGMMKLRHQLYDIRKQILKGLLS